MEKDNIIKKVLATVQYTNFLKAWILVTIMDMATTYTLISNYGGVEVVLILPKTLAGLLVYKMLVATIWAIACIYVRDNIRWIGVGAVAGQVIYHAAIIANM